MMSPPKPNLPPARKMVAELARHYFPRKKIHIIPLTGGLTNFVYAVKAGRDQFVARIGNEPGKIDSFLREQWAVSKARAKKIPLAEIFEVGNTIIPMPYMLAEKIEGTIANGHPEQEKILFELGKLSAIVHTIPTSGYGYNFAWSENELAVRKTWKDFLELDLDYQARLALLRRNKMISDSAYRNINATMKDIIQWKGRGVLQHGDIRLKNVMVDKKGNIKALIDWDNCMSAIGPSWDLSIALHDLPVDGQQLFLEGYGMGSRKLINLKDYLTCFNLLNYAPVVERLKKQKNNQALGYYRARMHGAMDLFSI